MFGNIVELWQRNKMLYHAMKFGSFVAAVLLIPLVQNQINERVSNEIAQLVLPYIITYIGAIYLLPEIGAILVLTFLGGDEN